MNGAGTGKCPQEGDGLVEGWDPVPAIDLEPGQDAFQTLAAAQHFENLQRAVQILTLMMCPAPEKHEDVIRCCLRPLGQPIISAAVQERLKAAMPDWMT
jgi:hypothetical protein